MERFLGESDECKVGRLIAWTFANFRVGYQVRSYRRVESGQAGRSRYDTPYCRILPSNIQLTI